MMFQEDNVTFVIVAMNVKIRQNKCCLTHDELWRTVQNGKESEAKKTAAELSACRVW